jgi:hypothetical protein
MPFAHNPPNQTVQTHGRTSTTPAERSRTRPSNENPSSGQATRALTTDRTNAPHFIQHTEPFTYADRGRTRTHHPRAPNLRVHVFSLAGAACFHSGVDIQFGAVRTGRSSSPVSRPFGSSGPYKSASFRSGPNRSVPGTETGWIEELQEHRTYMYSKPIVDHYLAPIAISKKGNFLARGSLHTFGNSKKGNFFCPSCPRAPKSLPVGCFLPSILARVARGRQNPCPLDVICHQFLPELPIGKVVIGGSPG